MGCEPPQPNEPQMPVWPGSDGQIFVREYVRTFLAYQLSDEGEFIGDGELAALHREALSPPAQPERQLRAIGRLSQTDDFYGTPGYNNRFGYRGYWFEPELGLYFVRNRVLDPRFGKWLTRDPIGYAGGWNLYRYVEGRPHGASDPMGLWPWSEPTYYDTLPNGRKVIAGSQRQPLVPETTWVEPSTGALLHYDGATIITVPPEVHNKKVFVPGERPLGVDGQYAIEYGNKQANGQAHANTILIWTAAGIATVATIAYVLAPDPTDPVVAALVAAKGIRAFIREGEEILGIGAKGEKIALTEAEQAAAKIAEKRVNKPGLGHITHAGSITADEALSAAKKWLGEGYVQISPGIYRSADGTRQFRMVDADLLGKHGDIGPHVHFEALDPKTGEVIENNHVPCSNP